MASYPKRRGSESESPTPTKKPASVAWFGIVALVILAGGAAVAMLTKQDKQSEAASQKAQDPAKQPFADLPAETPPPRSGGGADQPFGGLDAGNLGGAEAAATWAAAEKLAAEAETHYLAAVDAKAAGDVPTTNEQGAAAKAKFNEALESTALLEEQLIAKLGDSDPTVRALQSVRSTWFARLDWLLKSTAR